MRASSWHVNDGNKQALTSMGGSALADLRVLIERTQSPIACDTVVVHAPPESWPGLFEAGCRNIGCTAWETDRPPAHWMPLLALADDVVVPSAWNKGVFERAGIGVPVHVIPHIRRHTWNDYSPTELAQAREDLRIPAGNRIFYSINAWDPRKNMEALVRVFALEFDQAEPVTLLIKTGRLGHGPGPYYKREPTPELAARALGMVSGARGREPAQVIVHDEPLDAAGIDLIHALGDAFVSLTHGEAFGLGTFEAATRATPVIATNWSGHLDYLGQNWPGSVPSRSARVPLWPPHRPSYFPSQRWAQADGPSAGQLMRKFFDDPEPFRMQAREIRESIVQNFGEPVVARRWLDMLHLATATA